MDTLISYYTAKLVLEGGVENLKTFFPKFKNVVHRPTQSSFQKWLREIHNIHVFPQLISYPNEYDCNIYKMDIKPIMVGKINSIYEEALEVGLQEGLKLILKIQKDV